MTLNEKREKIHQCCIEWNIFYFGMIIDSKFYSYGWGAMCESRHNISNCVWSWGKPLNKHCQKKSSYHSHLHTNTIRYIWDLAFNILLHQNFKCVKRCQWERNFGWFLDNLFTFFRFWLAIKFWKRLTMGRRMWTVKTSNHNYTNTGAVTKSHPSKLN